MHLSTRPWSSARRRSSATRHRCPIEVGQLEGRLLMAGPGDVTAPTTVASLVGTAGQDGYFRSPVTVNFSATDPDDPSNTLTTFSSVNGGTLVAGNALALTNDGIYTVAYFSQDPAGNVEPAHTEIIRIDRTPPTITAVASPSTLFPPNHKLVAVTVTGHVADNLSGVAPTVRYHVVDEYGQDQPSGTVPVDASGNFRFVVDLNASRRGQDKDGRQFTIDVTASDFAGNQATTAPIVTVLHDMGNHNGQGDQDNGGSPTTGTQTSTGNQGGPRHHSHGNPNHGKSSGGGNQSPATHSQGRVTPAPVVIDHGNHGSNGQGNSDHGNHGSNGQGNSDHGNGDQGNHGNGHNQ